MFLPIIGWRWLIGVLPLVLVYGASDNEQVRTFGIYYAVPLIPFLVLGSAAGARSLAAVFWVAPRAEVMASYLVVLSALTVGLGYSVRPPRPELNAVKRALATLETDPFSSRAGCYPHAGYGSTVKLLAPHILHYPQNREPVILLAPALSAYPFTKGQRDCLELLPQVAKMPDGLLAVRSISARECSAR